MSDGVEKLAFSIDEAAVRANIGRDGIYQAIREKRLDAKKAGRRTLIPADALRRFIENLPSLQLPPLA
jgi:excisionase family DNA binding protein